MVVRVRQQKLPWLETDCTLSKGSASECSFYFLLLELQGNLRLLLFPCDCMLNSHYAVNLFFYMIVCRLT